MQTYLIVRRGGWETPEALDDTAPRSSDVRWIRSYVTAEPNGTFGTICVYQAGSADAIREHAARADMPADEILAVADTVVVRPDPEPVST